MHMQLSTSEVQTAVAEYLRRRGVLVGAPERIAVEIRDHSNARMSIAGCTAVVVAYEVEIPEPDGPYRTAAAGVLKP
jgi:hypothetical protein